MNTLIKEKTIQYISPEGELREEGLSLWSSLSEDEKINFYKWMLLSREFDKKSILLQRQGRMGTYASLEGQEAAQVGSALALSSMDWVFPSYREHAVSMIFGMPMSQILLYWMGRVEGCKAPQGIQLLPPSVPIATHTLHAVGCAWAAKIKNERSASVAYFGDGATSEGDFHEACNFAGIFKVPVIFLCQNNGYAISVPFSRQSASETVIEKIIPYNIPGYRVDGNDVLAVYDVMKKAVLRAHNGEGPTFIEAITYRINSHTTADDEKKYRSPAEVQSWKKNKDPLTRYEKLLKTFDLLNEELKAEILNEITLQIDAAIKVAENYGSPEKEHIFKHVFETEPKSLSNQRKNLH